MAETIVSPGVLAIENDQSQITQLPIEAGAAIVGPTVKGKVGIPTICTTYSDYSNKYGFLQEKSHREHARAHDKAEALAPLENCRN